MERYNDTDNSFEFRVPSDDVKIVFFNGDIEETIYINKSKNLVGDPKEVVCKLRKFTHGLKENFVQWYHKFHQVITIFGSEENNVNDYVYQRIHGRRFILLLMYGIQIATKDVGLLRHTKKFI